MYIPVASGDPNTRFVMDVVAFSDSLEDPLPVVMLTPSLYSVASITTGYSDGRPLGVSLALFSRFFARLPSDISDFSVVF